jgi:hypothetical protein
MGGKTDEQKHRRRQDAPSTGRGAASALDALIKQRIPRPGDARPPQQTQPKRH